MFKKIMIFLALIAVSAGIGYADLLTGQEILLTVFYLIPISIAAWFLGAKYGISLSFLSAGLWYYTESTAGREYSSALILYWDTVVLAIFFIVVAYLLGMIKKLLKEEREISRTDYLTGLSNRRYFFEAVEAEIGRSSRAESPFTIAYIDADNFKNVNDTLGHHAGDRVLIAAAEVLKKHIRKMDAAARLGGDEFALLLPTAGSGDSKIILDKIMGSLREEMNRSGFPVTFSVGVIAFKQFPGSADNAVKMADSLMYEVKKEGKNNAKFSVF